MIENCYQLCPRLLSTTECVTAKAGNGDADQHSVSGSSSTDL